MSFDTLNRFQRKYSTVTEGLSDEIIKKKIRMCFELCYWNLPDFPDLGRIRFFDVTRGFGFIYRGGDRSNDIHFSKLVKAIQNHVSRSLKKRGIRPSNVEGQDQLEWVLMDYFDFIIHIFSEDKREFYDIDRLWADAKITMIEDDNEK